MNLSSQRFLGEILVRRGALSEAVLAEALTKAEERDVPLKDLLLAAQTESEFASVLGHEIAGLVEQVADDVTGIAVGDRVAVSPSRPCGRCTYCQQGLQNHCLDMRYYGSAMRTPHVQGAFRQEIVCDASQAHKLADGIGDGEGAMADWSAVFLATVVGASEAQAALGYAVFSAAMVLARLAGDQVVRRLGPVTSARISGLLAAGGALTALLGGSFGVALAGFGLMGVGYAIVFPLAFSRAANDGEIPPGSAIASVATLAYGGMLVGPPAIGFIAAMTSLTHAFGLIAVLALAIVPLATSLRPAPRRARQEP